LTIHYGDVTHNALAESQAIQMGAVLAGYRKSSPALGGVFLFALA